MIPSLTSAVATRGPTSRVNHAAGRKSSVSRSVFGHLALLSSGRDFMATVRSVDIPGRDVCLEVLIEGDDPEVVLVPSANRDASDFDALTRDLRLAGFDSVSVNLRTIGGSTGPAGDLRLHDLADDVRSVIDNVVGRPAHLVGHAFGNTVVRATAAYHPASVASVTLLACGGHDMASDPLSDESLFHFDRCQQMDLPAEERIESLRVAFLPPETIPARGSTGGGPTDSAWRRSSHDQIRANGGMQEQALS